MTHKKRLATRALGSLTLALASLALSSSANADEIPVTVTFDEAGCPKSVSPETVDIKKAQGDRVKWIAVDQSGAQYKGGFSIIFDPFNGGRRLSTRYKSTLKSPPVDNSIPPDIKIEYKYSVLGRRCDTPLDPVIRVL